MKCIHCATHSRLRERKHGRCPTCRHRFVFEPRQDWDKVTDAQFKNAIDRVSGDGKVQFTNRQLWYAFNHRWMKPGFWRSPYGALPFAGTGSALLAALGVVEAPVLAVSLVVGGVGLVGAGALLNTFANARAPRPSRPPRISFDAFQGHYLRRWREVHGDVAGLLPVREVAALQLPAEVPADVAAFSFDRAVVTDTWETAAMLVANRFHFEHNCAVLSFDGYPGGIAATVKEMLRRNPRLTAFALHDASPDGCLLPLRLRGRKWFPDPAVRIVDLGLRPATARRLGVPPLAGAATRLPPWLGEILSAEDRAWLAEGHVGELASLRPAQVLRAAYRGIVAAGPDDGSGRAPAYDDGSWTGVAVWFAALAGGHGADTAAVDGFG